MWQEEEWDGRMEGKDKRKWMEGRETGTIGLGREGEMKGKDDRGKEGQWKGWGKEGRKKTRKNGIRSGRNKGWNAARKDGWKWRKRLKKGRKERRKEWEIKLEEHFVKFSYQERSVSRLPCSMTAFANCLKTRSMYVLCRGHRPSRKPIWPPWQVMSRARLGFCFTASTGMAAKETTGPVLLPVDSILILHATILAVPANLPHKTSFPNALIP